MAIICGSLNLLVFIKISSIIKPEKILLLKPVNWRGDYPGRYPLPATKTQIDKIVFSHLNGLQVLGC